MASVLELLGPQPSSEVQSVQDLLGPQPETDDIIEATIKTIQNLPQRAQLMAGGLLMSLGEAPEGRPSIYEMGDEGYTFTGTEWIPPPEGTVIPDPSFRNRGKGPIDSLLTNAGKSLATSAMEKLRANAPNVELGTAPFYVSATIGAIAEMVPALGASIWAKNPNVGLSIIGGQVFGPKYAESRSEGRTVNESRADAAVYAVSEILTEKIPFGILTKEGGKALTKLLKAAGAEGLQEPINQAIQTAYDVGISEDVTFAEAIRDPRVWAELRDSAVIGIFAGGGLATLSIGGQSAIDKLQSEAEAITSAPTIDDALDTAETILDQPEAAIPEKPVTPELPSVENLLGPRPEEVTPPFEAPQFTDEIPEVFPEEPATESVLGTDLDGSEIATVEVPLDELTLAGDIPQFKMGADPETGVVEPLGGEEYVRVGMAPIIVWERLSGKLEIATGRHRAHKARRLGEKTIPSHILRESDGWTAKKLAILDAEMNLLDGQGQVKDYVSYFQAAEVSKAEAESRGLLARGKGQRAYEIADEGSPELIAAHRNDQVTDAQAYAISLNAPGNSAVQAVGIKAVMDGKSTLDVVNLMKAVISSTPQGEETDMFGFDDSAMKAAEEMARIASRKQRQISTDLQAIQGAAKNPEVAKKYKINVKNPEALRKRITALKAERTAWENWHTNPKLKAEIDAEMAPVDQVAEEPAEPLVLKRETESQRTTRESFERAAAKKIADKKKAAELKAKVDEEAKEPLVLVGSDRIADQLTARGQKSLFEQKAEYNAKPRERVNYADEENPEAADLKFRSSQKDFTLDALFDVANEHQADLSALGEEIVAQNLIGTGTEWRNPGVKGKARAAEKLVERDGDISKMADIVRGGVAVQNPADADTVVDKLVEQYAIEDEGWFLTDEGYFDRKVTVRFEDGSLGEVQFWHPDIYQAKKDAGTAIYEKARVLPLGDPALPGLKQEMRDLYQPLLDALPSSWDGFLGREGTSGNLESKTAEDIGRAESVITATLTGVQESLDINQAQRSSIDTAALPSQEKNFIDITSDESIAKPGAESEILTAASLGAESQTTYSREQAEAVVDKLNKVANKVGVQVNVISSEEIHADVDTEGRRIKGFIIGNTAYLVHDHLKNDQDATVTYAHELKGHIGINNIIEDWDGVVSDYQDMKTAGGKEFRSIHDELTNRYGELDAETETKEFIAIAAERQAKKGAVGRFLDKVRALFNKGLRALGFTRPFSVSDVNVLLSRSEQFLKTPDAISPVESAEAENAQAEAKGLPMDKASRMARAEEMGFDTSQIFYHGTSSDFGGFDNKLLGKITNHPQARLGYYFTQDAELAGFFGTSVIPVMLRGKYLKMPLDEFYNITQETPVAEVDEMRDNAIRAGYDGIEITEPAEPVSDIEGGDTEVGVKIAFNPNQIRSIHAAFDPDFQASGEILASREDGGPPRQDDLFSPPTPTEENSTFKNAVRMADPIRYILQDKLIDLRRRQEAMDPPESSNTYLAESIWQGRAGERLTQFEENDVNPLLEKVAEAKLEIEEVDSWLHARHAVEANAALKTINPNRTNNEALSGMTDAEAASVLAQHAGNAALQEAGRMVDRINQNRVSMLVSEGLLTQKEATAWTTKYKKYIPLNRAETSDLLPPRGQGFNIRGPESKRRVGSVKDVVNVLAGVVGQYESSIIRAEKNRVDRALYNFVLENSLPEWWSVDKTKMMSVVINNEVQQVVDPREYENELKLKIDGKSHTITFNENNVESMRIVRAMKNLDQGSMGTVVRYLLAINRFLSAINTSWSPEFIPSNFFRDLQTAGYNLTSTELKGMEMAILKQVPSALKGLKRNLRNQDTTSEWGQWAQRFKDAGGKTGWIDAYNDLEKQRSNLEKKLKLFGQGKKEGAFRTLVKFVEDYNTIVENGVRLSAFRKGVDVGMSDRAAAGLAKDLTVNFNRKGMAGPTMNALYLFYNASIQGSVRMLQTLTTSSKGRKLAAATIGFAAVLDILNRALSGDDDDGENIYDNLPNHLKNRNWILMGEKEPIVKIPLPWGYNILHVIGQEMGDLTTGERYKPGDSAGRIVSSMLDAFNPVGHSTFLQTLAPTVADPFVQIGENKNWTGAPLKPEGSVFGPEKPQSQQFWSSSREISKDIAAALNDWSGGDTIRPGAIDMSPEWIDVFIDFAGGSAVRVAADSFNIAHKAVTGEDIAVNEIPMLRKVYGYDSRRGVQSRYYEWSEDIQYHVLQLNDPANDETIEDLLDNPRTEMISDEKAIRKELVKLRREKRVIQSSNLSDKKEQIKEIDSIMRESMAFFNKEYAEVVLGE